MAGPRKRRHSEFVEASQRISKSPSPGPPRINTVIAARHRHASQALEAQVSQNAQTVLHGDGLIRATSDLAIAKGFDFQSSSPQSEAKSAVRAAMDGRSPPQKRLKRASSSPIPSTRETTSPPCNDSVSTGDGSKEDEGEEEQLALLFWRDDEIVGYYSDDPEDDGEGVNGIGYRQSMAERRVIERKRQAQIREWRTREAAEDRARRGNRRRGGYPGVAAGAAAEENVGRKVRFQELVDQQRAASAS